MSDRAFPRKRFFHLSCDEQDEWDGWRNAESTGDLTPLEVKQIGDLLAQSTDPALLFIREKMSTVYEEAETALRDAGDEGGVEHPLAKEEAS